jgi:two-component system sensor histidine kinase KdpD
MRLHLRVGPLGSIVVSVALAAIATAAAWAMDGAYSLASQAMLYLLAVVFASFYVGSPTSILTTVFGAGALNFFFIPPRYTFAVEQEYWVDLGAMLLVSLVVSGLAARLRAETEQARRGERRAREIYALAETIGQAREEGELVQQAANAMLQAFGAPCCIVLRDSSGKPVRGAQAPEKASVAIDLDAAQWVIENQMTIGPTTGYWPRLPAWYVPLPSVEASLGVAVIDVGDGGPGKTEDDLRHAETLVRQIAVAIQRSRLSEQAYAAAREVEAESVRSALLASISHDFRTPLAVIIGAASTLSERYDRLDAAQRSALLSTVESEAAQMNAVAENVLQLAKLSSGVLALRRDWESLEEVIGAVVARFRARKLDRRLRTHVPSGLPLVYVDGVLVAQVAVNLIDNAVKHSPPDGTIEIDVHRKDSEVEVSVKDRGSGIGDGDDAALFQKFYRGRAESAESGIGLGLAICKAVVEAHGGRIWARNRSGGGAVFRFTLPLDRPEPTVAAEVAGPRPRHDSF